MLGVRGAGWLSAPALLRRGLPRRTVRLRLTALYGALFLISGAGLLAITYVLVRHSTNDVVITKRISGLRPPPRATFYRAKLPNPPALGALQKQAGRLAAQQRAAELHQLLVQSGIALAIMALVSIALGWLVAGRVLRPLRTMTATTRRISERNLHERLSLAGPDDELKELGDTIDGLLARLEAAFDSQRRFVANASHELRTPLAMMRTSLDVATAKRGAGAPQLTALEPKLREGLGQAEALLESFLTLARAEHAETGDHARVSVRVLGDVAIDQVQHEVAAKRISVERALADVEVRGSETLLARLVANLVDNAVRHNHACGWLRVVAKGELGRARLTVENSGPRLDRERVAQLAEPFRRLREERTGSEDGVGLGLSIVAAITTAHGGTLELAARPEGGLRATVELPRAPSRENGRAR